jgi:hypothetical protein
MLELEINPNDAAGRSEAVACLPHQAIAAGLQGKTVINKDTGRHGPPRAARATW